MFLNLLHILRYLALCLTSYTSSPSFLEVPHTQLLSISDSEQTQNMVVRHKKPQRETEGIQLEYTGEGETFLVLVFEGMGENRLWTVGEKYFKKCLWRPLNIHRTGNYPARNILKY